MGTTVIDENSTPAPPEAARFDAAQQAWILSRYADVWSALREPNLWPVSGKREIVREGRESDGRLQQRAPMLEAIAGGRVEEWRPRLIGVTQRGLASLARESELLSDFLLPWGLSLAMMVTGAEGSERARLGELSTRVFAATGVEHKDAALRADAAAATAELERIFEGGPVPMGEPAFVALSQTLPRLLANGWVALARNPAEFARLRANPELLPGAIDELLRYAGIVRRVYRRSTAPVELGGVTIAEGELAALMLASANRDPEQFPDPDRLDLGRVVSSHVALGTGRNSCVGAMLIRMAASVATEAVAERFVEFGPCRVGEWRTGSGFCFPASVFVTLKPDAKHF
uniref:Cytochrome P450-like n=1 Tax=Solibacter usitatus (strain Ellin6076) TaxID=234267 RepID=Q01S26_SOLUE